MRCCTKECLHYGRMWDMKIFPVRVCCKCDDDGGCESMWAWYFEPVFFVCWWLMYFMPDNGGFPVQMGCDFFKHKGMLEKCDRCG